MMKILWTIAILMPVGVILGFALWPAIINHALPEGNRPIKVAFTSEKVTPKQFNLIAADLRARYGQEFPHIQRFREAGVYEYDGPQTCLGCHKEVKFTDHATGKEVTENLMDNLTRSAHYRFYTTSHPNVYGFDGQVTGEFRMGKIDRACPLPGSFAMTAWASPVVLKSGDTLSDGCGQCHIGGEPTAPMGSMMPGYRVTDNEKYAIDCLICHSVSYDMNQKQIVRNQDGRWSWGQDRSIRAAMAVTRPISQACLRCHQHDFGGDRYIDSTDVSYMESLTNSGTDRPRVKHPGSKRGTPFSPSWDVHAAAGLNCIDCHATEGHRIANGTHTTTLMANDLPGVEVACENCHTATPHNNSDYADFLNDHVDKIACQTCHIPSLQEDNVTKRDFSAATFEEDPGIWIYSDIEKENEPGKGIAYVWWNGDGTFLGNPIGDNPNGKNLYRFYRPTHVWPEYKDFDYTGWYEQVMRPIAKKGRPSKIYGMKRFNGRQHIDLQNMGPFGGMYVPYDLPVYYTSGDPDSAAATEMHNPTMKMMYGWIFKEYMMNRFMHYMDVDEWNTGAYKDAERLRDVEPRWIPQDASIEISHAIRKKGALTCENCHSSNSVLDFTALGYDSDEVQSLQEPRL